jgi:hypothetical protein
MSDDKVRYFIGITGHRHLPLDRLPALTAEIQAFYEVEKAEHGTENITVLSPLAEGADTLCAKLAVDMGLRLAAPLPMSKSEYREDFSGNALAEFDFLLSMADEVFTVTPEEPVLAHPQRGFYYRQAGIYVAKNCDILLAVWDGAEQDTPDGAGTWETVKLAREFGKELYLIVSSQLHP